MKENRLYHPWNGKFFSAKQETIALQGMTVHIRYQEYTHNKRYVSPVSWDSQVRSTATDSRSVPAEVPRFESGSQH